MTSYLPGSGAPHPHTYQISIEAAISGTHLQNPQVVVPLEILWPGLVIHLNLIPRLTNLPWTILNRFCFRLRSHVRFPLRPIFCPSHCAVTAPPRCWLQVDCKWMCTSAHPGATVTGLTRSVAALQSCSNKDLLQNWTGRWIQSSCQYCKVEF